MRPTAGPLPSPTADGLAASAQAASRKGPPPVHLWNPPFCGDIDMRIARDGTWFYQGSPIGRPGLVALFSGILKKEGGRYFLVTPVEKVGITVDDVPFVAVDFDVTTDTPAAPPPSPAATQDTAPAQTLVFTTHVGDRVPLDADHPLRVERDPRTGEPSPYLHVRAGLEARIDRKSFYRMVDLCVHAEVEGKDWFGLWSSGRFFPVIPSEDLP